MNYRIGLDHFFLFKLDTEGGAMPIFKFKFSV